jgi:hypothetical protein
MTDTLFDWTFSYSKTVDEFLRQAEEQASPIMSVAWGLEQCCDRTEIVFLCCYAAYALVALVLGKMSLLKPVRLLSVFVHEFGHASACWLTGGSVKKIEVYNNEGGVTGYTGVSATWEFDDPACNGVETGALTSTFLP